MKPIDPAKRLAVLHRSRDLKMARSAHAYVRGNTANFYDWLEETEASAMFRRGRRSGFAGIVTWEILARWQTPTGKSRSKSGISIRLSSAIPLTTLSGFAFHWQPRRAARICLGLRRPG